MTILYPDTPCVVNTASSLSRGAFALLALIHRLSRRTGFAHVRIEPSPKRPGKSLSEMLGKCARTVHYYLDELRRAGAIETQTDYRMLYARPLVEMPKTAKKPGPPRSWTKTKIQPETVASVPPIAELVAELPSENCRASRERTLSPTVSTDTTNIQAPADKPDPTATVDEATQLRVVVELQEAGLPKPIARAVASAAATLTTAQRQAVLDAYRSARSVQNPIGWLIAACRARYTPSETLEEKRPIRVVRAPRIATGEAAEALPTMTKPDLPETTRFASGEEVRAALRARLGLPTRETRPV